MGPSDEEIDDLLRRSREARARYDAEHGAPQTTCATRAGSRPFLEVLERLDGCEAGLSEDLSDEEIADAHGREARELKARCCRRPIPHAPPWAELDPRLDNVERHTIAALLEVADARGVAHLDATAIAERIDHVTFRHRVAEALEHLRALGLVVPVGSGLLVRRRA